MNTTIERDKKKALALFESQDFINADQILLPWLETDPGDVEYWYIYSGIKGLLKDFAAAEQYCRMALKIDKQYGPALFRLANALDHQGQHAEALDYFDKALELLPQQAHVWNNKGVCLMCLGRPADAELCYRQSIELDPAVSGFTINLGLSLLAQNIVADAITAFESVLEKKPDNVEAGWSLANALLLTGQFEQGWQYYNYRWNRAGKSKRVYHKPLWQGEKLHGKRLYIYPEQGYGDEIQFIRFVAPLLEQGVKILLEVPAALATLFTCLSPAITQLVGTEANESDFDYHAPLADVVAHTVITEQDIITPQGYLQCSRSDKTGLPEQQNQSTAKLNVGLVWAGNPKHENDFNRSIALDRLAPLMQLPVRYFSLQKRALFDEEHAFLKQHGIADITPMIGDFNDTAWILHQLDLLISVDTSVAHLAGALGVPVWVMLPFAPDWRWQLERTDSPWYSSAVLYRQHKVNSWESVIAEIGESLQLLLDQKR